MNIHIHEVLQDNEQALGVHYQRRTVSGRFAEFIRLAHERHRALVVVQVDKYDKSILDNLTNLPTYPALNNGDRHEDHIERF